MPTRSEAIDQAQGLVDTGQFASELAQLVSCPTESQNPQRTKEMRAYLEATLVPRLTKSGFTCTIHENQMNNAFLIARRIEDANLPTLLSYGHGDVTRGQEEDWTANRKPFELQQEGNRLYGRGTADNKGQHLINILALKLCSRRVGNLAST